MPAGQVQRVDNEREKVYIVQKGKTYTAPLSEVEVKARVPSARVLFDLVREHGVESAADVRLRSGTRTNRRQRRFGDLTGAARPGAKVQTAASRTYGVDVTTQPFRLARTWLDAVSAQEYDGATSLYLPDAIVHTEAGAHLGRRRIRAALELLPFDDVDQESIELHGIDQYVQLTFTAGDAEHVTYLITKRGSIVEQWIDVEPVEPADEIEDRKTVLVVRHGDVPDQAAEHATERIDRIVEHSGRKLRSAKIKLSMADNPTFDRPAVAEASLEFDHLLVRASADAESFGEAIDMMATRLATRIEHQHDRQRHRPTRLEALPGTWRHGNLARAEKPFFDRPREEREIVRHKTFAPEAMTPDEAAFDMALLDYDFFLFVEVESGQDALLVQAADGSLVIHRTRGLAPLPGSGATVNDFEPAHSVASKLAVSEAIELLDNSGDRLEFFVNRQTERGNVIYRRLDGHYGLITPSDEDDQQEHEER